jgi:hypothetical protein
MLADYEKALYPIDRRLKLAELDSPGHSVCVARDGSVGKTTAGHIEALDWFMAAITDEKLFKTDEEIMEAVTLIGGVPERGSPGKAY